MTINLTDVTFDLLVAEQLHDIVPCSQCNKAAHWYIKCSGCGWLILRCSPHRAKEDADVPRYDGAECAQCDTDLPVPLPWVAL